MSALELESLEMAAMRMRAASRALRVFLSLLESAQPDASFSAADLRALIAPAVGDVDEASSELATVVH